MAARLEGLLALQQKNIKFGGHCERGRFGIWHFYISFSSDYVYFSFPLYLRIKAHCVYRRPHVFNVDVNLIIIFKTFQRTRFHLLFFLY